MHSLHVFHGIDFVIQEYGHSNVDIYHGNLHMDSYVSQEGNGINESDYCATGHVVNDLTGDKGVINLKKHGKGYCFKYDVEINLKHYDPVKKIEEVRSINKSCIMVTIPLYNLPVLLDEHSLLVDDSAKDHVSKEPTVSMLLYYDDNANQGEMFRYYLKNSYFPNEQIVDDSKIEK